MDPPNKKSSQPRQFSLQALRLIAYLHDAVQERLPGDLVAGAEEEVVTIGASEVATAYRPDVQVPEPWTLKEPPAAATASTGPPTLATEPIRVFVDEEIERWVEIRDLTGRLITVIELLNVYQPIVRIPQCNPLLRLSGVPGNGSVMALTNTAVAGPARFYRVAVE